VYLCVLFYGFLSYAQDNKVTQVKPAESKFSTSEKSIIERTSSFENHSTLMRVLKAANLDKVLGYKGRFTVFAPSNLAFEKLSKITIDNLNDPKNNKALRDILSYHIIAEKLSASTILKAMCRGNGTAKFTTMQGDKITATMNGIDIVLTDKSGNQAVIVTADSNQSNGIIHEIDTVFMPYKMF
tara:strand:- start:40 stop:591 length:552 start_codon:yes stop_codon:yes gene_type:complete